MQDPQSSGDGENVVVGVRGVDVARRLSALEVAEHAGQGHGRIARRGGAVADVTGVVFVDVEGRAGAGRPATSRRVAPRRPASMSVTDPSDATKAKELIRSRPNVGRRQTPGARAMARGGTGTCWHRSRWYSPSNREAGPERPERNLEEPEWPKENAD
jgi:hypothetical protein